jgi:DNA-binding NarL/FixJ family response regulator
MHPLSDPIRVLIVTGDNMTGELLKNAFARGRKDFAVETSVGSSQKVIGNLGEHKPHVAVICEDLADGQNAGFKVLQKLRDSNHGSAAIMLLQHRKASSVIDAFRDGARGIFYRTHSLKALSKCIRTVRNGQIWASNEDLEHILSALSHLKEFRLNDADGIPLLTRREEEVVRLVADGLKNREIAQRLNVKEHSIRNYLYRIFDKLGVSTRVELILYALNQWGR